MTQEKPRVTVSAIVHSKVEVAGKGWKVGFTIPEFHHNEEFDINVDRIPAEDAALLVLGTTANIILAKGNVRKKKDETPHDGTLPWMFWWNWIGIAAPGSAPAPTPAKGGADATSAPPPPAARGWSEAYSQSKEAADVTRASIERQKALDLAVQFRLGIATLTKEPTDVEQVLATAVRLCLFVRGDKAEEPPAKAPAPAATKPAPTPAAGTPPVRDEQSVRAEAISAARGWNNQRFLKEFEPRAKTTWREASPLTKAAVMDAIEREVPIAKSAEQKS